MYNEIDLDAIDTTQEPPTEEPARQYYFMAKCRQWVREFEQKNGRRPFAFTQTFGYEMNAREVEAVIIHLEKKVVCQLRYQSMSQLRKFILDGEIDRRK